MKRQIIFITSASVLSVLLIIFILATPRTAVAMLAGATPSPTALSASPPITVTPFADDLVLAPIQAGESSGFQVDIMVPPTALVNDKVVFRDQMLFEWRFKAAQGQDNAIIASVAITIFKGASDNSGEPPVYHRIETTAPYCAFGHTTDHCDRIWTFADTNDYWPQADSEAITPSDILLESDTPYTAQIVMTTHDGRIEERDLTFTLQSQDQPVASSGIHFVHKATAANINLNWTEIDHPLANGNLHAIIFVTPNWNPDGQGGVYNNHPIGVWYNHKTNRWAIFNQDIIAMPVGAAFNVLLFPN